MGIEWIDTGLLSLGTGIQPVSKSSFENWLVILPSPPRQGNVEERRGGSYTSFFFSQDCSSEHGPIYMLTDGLDSKRPREISNRAIFPLDYVQGKEGRWVSSEHWGDEMNKA